MINNKRALVAVVAALVFGLLLSGAAFAKDGNPKDLAVLEALQNGFREVAKEVIPSVVQINVVDVLKMPMTPFSPFDFFFGPQPKDPKQKPQQREFRQQGLGSGVIVRKVGNKAYVLTNNHVVGQAEEISLKLSDQRQFKATLVGKDDKKDLALVVFETRDPVPVAELGNSDSLQVGDWVLAIGNPLGFESTVTAGIVSARGRHSVPGSDISGYTDYLQTDASINQGNSGGALVNLRGEVVGINAWIASPSGGSVGLGFAIPINNAKKAIDDFITKGKVEYGWVGINIGNPAPLVLADMRLENIQGAFVYGVFKGSPADKAGIQPGDYITRVNNEAIKDSTELLLAIGNFAPGAQASFELLRYGARLSLSVRISARQDEKEIAGQAVKNWPGMAVVKISDDIRKQLKLSRDAGEILIGNVDKGSPADVAGFRPGDIVRKINNQEVRTVLEFYKTLNESANRELLFTLYREGTEVLLGFNRR